MTNAPKYPTLHFTIYREKSKELFCELDVYYKFTSDCFSIEILYTILIPDSILYSK